MATDSPEQLDSNHPLSATYDPVLRALAIRDLVITDPVVLSEISRWTTGTRGPVCEPEDLVGADLSAFCSQAIAAGAMAISAAGGTQEAHHLDRLIDEVGARTTAASAAAAKTTTDATARAAFALEKAAEGVQKSIRDAAQQAREGIVKQVQESRHQLSEEIGRLVGGNDPVLAGKLKVVLTTVGAELDERATAKTDEMLMKAARQLDPRDPTSPMAAVTKHLVDQQTAMLTQFSTSQKDVTERLEKLSLAVQAASASTAATKLATQSSPRKGLVYADDVHESLAAFAFTQGDEYLDTSADVGRLTRCKKGDGVLVVACPNGTARIVVEMTDSDTAPRSWNDYLEEAERNRDAALSLGLVRTVDQMPDGARLRNYGHRRFVLAFDPETDDDGLLHAVLLLLRGQAALALGRGPAENLRTAEGKLNEAVRCLERLAEVQKTAGSIRKGADKIDTDCAWMQTAVNRLLAEAAAALGTAADVSEAAA